MYQQISLFDLQEAEEKSYDFDTFIALVGSNFRDYDKRVEDEYEKSGAISPLWLKNEFGHGGWSCPHVKCVAEVTKLDYFKGNVIELKYFNELDEEKSYKTNYQKVSKALNKLLQIGSFKELNREEACNLIMRNEAIKDGASRIV